MATVNSSATSVALLASNSQRKGAVIRNSDANTLYVTLAAGAATTANAHYVLNNGDTLELHPAYRGDVVGIWSAAGSGAALIQEF